MLNSRRSLWWIQRTALVFVAMLLMAAPARASFISLAWDPNPESDIAGYILFYGTASANYTSSFDVGNVTTWTNNSLADGQQYFFAVKAYDSSGLQSAFSAELTAMPFAAGKMLAPSPGSTLNTASALFQWSPGSGASQYRVSVGVTAGGTTISDQTVATTSVTVSGLPASGAVFVRLWSLIGETWHFADYTYSASRPVLTIDGLSVAEGNSGSKAATFSVRLNPVASQVVTVQYSTANGTAVSGSDYVATSGTLTIAAGVGTGAIAVSITGDTAVEVNETFLLRLSGASPNATIGSPQATGTIVNDDAAPPVVPPTVSAVSPVTGATGVSAATKVVATFSTPMTTATITTTTMTLMAAGSGTPVAATVVYDAAARTATLAPTTALGAGTVYNATVKGGAAGVKDLAGTPVAADRVWSFTIAPAAGGVSALSDRTWTSMTNGWGPVEKDRSNAENVAGDGRTITLNGVTHAKGLGAHGTSEIRYTLSGACSLLTALVGVDDEVGANGSVVFQVWTDGVKKFESAVMTGATATAPVSVALTGITDLRLVITDGGNGNSFDHGDWASPQLTCSTDTTPPTVTTVLPAAGSTGFSVSADLTATFSEAMAAATLTAATVRVVPQGSATPLASALTYNAGTKVLTINPNANLTAGLLYTVTLKGGTGGTTDVAGNPLATDKAWTFTTAPPVTTVSYLSDWTWTSMTNGWGPVEKDRSNGETAAGDGRVLTLNGVAYAKGLGAHAASDVRYALKGACSTLTALVGVDDEVLSNGGIVFQIWTDGIKRYESGLMTGSTATASVNVNMIGVSELALIITDGGNGPSSDHGDWASAQLACIP